MRQFASTMLVRGFQPRVERPTHARARSKAGLRVPSSDDHRRCEFPHLYANSGLETVSQNLQDLLVLVLNIGDDARLPPYDGHHSARLTFYILLASKSRPNHVKNQDKVERGRNHVVTNEM